MTDELITTGEVARRIGKGSDRVRQLITEGHLRPAYRANDGRYLFRGDDVSAYVEQRAARLVEQTTRRGDGPSAG